MYNSSSPSGGEHSTRHGLRGILRGYRTLVATLVVLSVVVGGFSYSFYLKYKAAHVKFVSINGQVYYTRDFMNYMSVKMGDIAPSVLNSTAAFQFYQKDFVRYKLIYQEAEASANVAHVVIESEIRNALEENASKNDVRRILSDKQVFNSFLELSYGDSVIHNYIVESFYTEVSVSPMEISQEYDRIKGVFANYPIHHMLGVVTDNTTLQGEILEELREYDFEEVAHRYDEGYDSVFLQEGFLTPDAIPEQLLPLVDTPAGESYLYDQGGVHHIYQVLGVYRSSRNFIPLDLLKDSIGRALYHSKVNSYIDDYIEILYSTSDIQYYMPDGTVVYGLLNP